MKMFLIELRRSMLRWWFPAFLAMDLAAVFGRSHWWIGVWPQASAAAQIPSLFFAPLLGAGAAAAAARAHRPGIAEQTAVAARSRWRLEAVQVTATLTYGLLAYAIGALAAGIISLPDAGPGFLWPGYLLLGVSVIIGSVGIGHLAGRAFHSRFAVPVIIGLGIFVFLGAFGSPNKLQLYYLTGDPQIRIAAVPLLARLLCSISLLAIAIIVASILRHRGERAWASVARSGAVVGIVMLLVASIAWIGQAGPLRSPRPAPASPVCTTTAPRVCLWPDDRKYIPAVAAMMRRLNAIPRGLFAVPDAFYERGLRDSRSHPSDFIIIEGDPWSISPGIWAAIAQSTFPHYCTPSNQVSEQARMQAIFELDQWMESRLNGQPQPESVHGGPPGVNLTMIASLLAQPDSEQMAWARQRVELIRSGPCA